ncbi:hypothetical protein HF847_05110 [Clostridium cochlearium]|uniref:hypothetical protein n=1 Tax=Clostridium cochlearium TaxID=1494 RepID=UPI0014597678|nr:hypothetical protein [Clostridium cochlearium]NME95372.1 hypothetical protein [Clostridium cochlearium]
MKKIKYFNKEFISQEELTDEDGLKTFKPIYELKSLEYQCKDNEFEYWLDVIKKSYGQYGEVTYEDSPDVKTKDELQQEINAKLLKNSANLQIELEKQKKINAILLVQVAQLGGNK